MRAEGGAAPGKGDLACPEGFVWRLRVPSDPMQRDRGAVIHCGRAQWQPGHPP